MSANDDLSDNDSIKPPFPWFGGKSRVAGTVWAALGDVQNYIANFWRAVHAAPEEVAEHADWPVNETDLFARHAWLVNSGPIQQAIPHTHQPATFASKWAGSASSAAIRSRSGWCSGTGPHRPHLGDEGRGVNRNLPHLGDEGRGVNRKCLHLINVRTEARGEVAHVVLAASRDVRVCCGDWSRVVTDGATSFGSTVGVFLDPPYLDDVRTKGLYREDGGGNTLAHDVRAWALSKGDDPRFRIVLAGYETEHEAHMPASWSRVAWRARRAYGTASGTDRMNRDLERLWLSPHCLVTDRQAQSLLFGAP